MKMLEPPGERYRVTVLLQRIVYKWEFLKNISQQTRRKLFSLDGRENCFQRLED